MRRLEKNEIILFFLLYFHNALGYNVDYVGRYCTLRLFVVGVSAILCYTSIIPIEWYSNNFVCGTVLLI